jgi:hypothetical protein
MAENSQYLITWDRMANVEDRETLDHQSRGLGYRMADMEDGTPWTATLECWRISLHDADVDGGYNAEDADGA